MAKAGYFSEDALISCASSARRSRAIRRVALAASRQPPLARAGPLVSLGLALGAKLAGSPSRVYCILGDGEIQEGQVWEAAMAAPRLGHPAHPVDNLTVIVATTRSARRLRHQVLDLEPVVSKWQAFGWR